MSKFSRGFRFFSASAEFSWTLAIKLERIQCSVARSLLKAEWNTPKETLLRSLNWPSSRWRREIRAVLLFFFFYLPKRRPAPLSECLYPFAYSKSHRSFRKPYQLLLLPYTNSKILSSPFFIGPLHCGTLCRTQHNL